MWKPDRKSWHATLSAPCFRAFVQTVFCRRFKLDQKDKVGCLLCIHTGNESNAVLEMKVQNIKEETAEAVMSVLKCSECSSLINLVLML